jgi:hypothetical protein
MANNPVAQHVIKVNGAGNVQVYPLLAGTALGGQDGNDVGTGGPALATLEANADLGDFPHSRVVEFLNDRYALMGNIGTTVSGCYKKNHPTPDDWGQVAAMSANITSSRVALTGLHVLHPGGVPTLAWLYTEFFSELRLKRTTDGITGAAWVGGGNILVETSSGAPNSYGQSIVYKDSIVQVHARFTTGGAGAGQVTQYDLSLATLTRYDATDVTLDLPASALALHVHDGVLFLFGFRVTNEKAIILKLSGGSFGIVYEDASQGINGVPSASVGHSAMFTDTATGDLVTVMSEGTGSKVVSLADATGAATPTDRSSTVMGATEGADKYLPGGGAADDDRRWSVFVDTETLPGTPRTFLTTWIPGGSTETWEWKGLAAEMELVGAGAGVAGDDIALPYNTVGGGERSPSTSHVTIGDEDNPPAEVSGGTQIFFRGSGSDTAKTLTFRGVDDQGAPSTIVPMVPASLTLTTPLFDDALEVYYKFNSDLLDYSGNGLVLSVAGSIPYTAGLIGDAANLPGTAATDFFHRPFDDANLDIGQGFAPYAVSCWVDVDTLSTTANIAVKGTTWILRVLTDGTLEWATTATLSTPSGTITVGAGLQHIVVTSDGSFTKIYVDGVEVASAATVTVNNGGVGLVIGNKTTLNEPLDGLIDEFAVWSRALTVGEVGFLYNAGSGHELENDTPWTAGQPSISGNTVTNLTPDESQTLYSVVLDTTTAGIDEGETGLLIAELA